MAADHGGRVYDSLDGLADDIEAAVVAVPTADHAEVGVHLLERGVHVLVEKPIAPSLAEADRLIAAAEAAERVLAVGHVEFFNPVVQRLLADGARPGFVEVQRLGAFSQRSLDVDVILDLMIHDLQILHALDPAPVAEVRATGVAVLSPRVDIANVRLALESGCVANLTASRVSFDKVRKLRIFSPQRYVSVDYQRQEIVGYCLEDRGGERGIRRQDLEVHRREPLRGELEGFVGACLGGGDARIVPGSEARRSLETALQVVSAIENSPTASA